jgi:hypothetical protein
MISDKVRNQFYDKILQSSVAGKNCIDIGFGSGLLSYLALKHGAKHITAFEINPDFYLQGDYLIKKLDLENKITLHHAAFDRSYIEKDHHIVFSELVDMDLWGEGVFPTFNNQLKKIPSKYACEFYFYELTDQELAEIETYSNLYQHQTEFQKHYNNIRGTDWPDCMNLADIYKFPRKILEELLTVDPYILDRKFDPGVEIDSRYIHEIEKIQKLNLLEVTMDNKIHYIKNDFFPKNINDAKEKYNKFLARAKLFASYTLDVNSRTWIDINQNHHRLDLQNNFIDLTVKKALIADKNFLILPRYYIAHNEQKLYLVGNDSHWHIPKLGFGLIKKINSDLNIRPYFSHIYDKKNPIKYYY